MRINHFLVLIFLFFCSISNAQEKSFCYDLLVEMDIPDGLKRGIPGEILIDPAKEILIVDFDYKPAQVAIYSIKENKLLTTVELKGYSYFYKSYFQLDENSVYIYYGGMKKDYMKIDLNSLDKTKISCHEAPRGCSFEGINTISEFKIGTEMSSINYDLYLLKYSESKIWVYLKNSNS